MAFFGGIGDYSVAVAHPRDAVLLVASVCDGEVPQLSFQQGRWLLEKGRACARTRKQMSLLLNQVGLPGNACQINMFISILMNGYDQASDVLAGKPKENIIKKTLQELKVCELRVMQKAGTGRTHRPKK
eukprot:5957501-Amphidinium_carterae.3